MALSAKDPVVKRHEIERGYFRFSITDANVAEAVRSVVAYPDKATLRPKLQGLLKATAPLTSGAVYNNQHQKPETYSPPTPRCLRNHEVLLSSFGWLLQWQSDVSEQCLYLGLVPAVVTSVTDIRTHPEFFVTSFWENRVVHDPGVVPHFIDR